jgi:hypothetical protein
MQEHGAAYTGHGLGGGGEHTPRDLARVGLRVGVRIGVRVSR